MVVRQGAVAVGPTLCWSLCIRSWLSKKEIKARRKYIASTVTRDGQSHGVGPSLLEATRRSPHWLFYCRYNLAEKEQLSSSGTGDS